MFLEKENPNYIMETKITSGNDVDPWDDSAILKAFERAVTSAKAKVDAGIDENKENRLGEVVEGEEEDYSAADAQFETLLRNGTQDPAQGVPGPWERVPTPNTEPAKSPDENPIGDFFSNLFGGNGRAANRHQEATMETQPPAGGPSSYYPYPPMAPTPGMASDAAMAMNSLDEITDDHIHDLCMAWYYCGYFTGRYRAHQELQISSSQQQAQGSPPPR
mmetsp:Transcript_32714/g.43064  ORF Transcript_32714/g.43064 Transcript_32714/m.43064 type:complete len:219 (+) Transcript_32714:42-698(+)